MRKYLLPVMAFVGAVFLGSFTSAGASASQAGNSGPLDARAAAARDAGKVTGRPGVQASWYSGNVQPGASQYWVWQNIPTGSAYQAALAPVGATTSTPCDFEVTKSWYEQVPGGGSRQFHFTIKNIGTIACATQVLLAGGNGSYVTSTSAFDPGWSQHHTWNVDVNRSYLVGIAPSGATLTKPCKFEVTRRTQLHAKLNFTVQNTGPVACSADLYILEIADTTGWKATVPADGYTYTHWNNNPPNAVYVPTAYNDVFCPFEIPRTWYRQHINTNGSTEREFHLKVELPPGFPSCTGTIRIATMWA